MKTEKEIKEQIKKVTESSQHVLDCRLATIDDNAPRALMQISAAAKLDTLYWVLGKKRPKFEYDKMD